MEADASLAVLRQRAAALQNVRGEATLKLTDAKGQTVSLDAAFVLDPPGRCRLRAWKFGQAVFDLTLDGERAWAYLPRDEAKPAAPGLRQAVGRWLTLLGGGEHAFDGDARTVGNTIVIRRTEPDTTTLEIIIDRPTLTPRTYRVRSDDNVERFRLELSDYRVANDGQLWPMTIRAVSATGTVEVLSRDVEMNTDIDAGAFKPPARAEALP
jgi:hypothetical protein